MEIDLLVLTVYFICIGYVVYQMALSLEAELEDQVVLVPNGEYLENTVKTQLAQQGLAHLKVEVLNPPPPPLKGGMALRLTLPNPIPPSSAEVDELPEGQILLQVLPQGPQPIQPLKALTVNVINQTQTLQATVDWDRSSFSRANSQISRVIRHTPGMRLDLSLPQVPSAVNPNQFLSTAVTSEETYSRNPESQVLQISAPMVNIQQTVAMPPPLRTYGLDLVLQLTSFSGRGMRPIAILVPFRFQVELLPDRAAIPFVNWVLKR
jgi:hypothetical protein